jgi:hypothetical protein
MGAASHKRLIGIRRQQSRRGDALGHLCCGYESGRGPASISYALPHILAPVALALELKVEMQDDLPVWQRRKA